MPSIYSWRAAKPFYDNGIMAAGSRFVQSLKRPWLWIGACLILGVIGLIALGPITEDQDFGPRESTILQKPRFINLLLFSYANDHGGKYPTANSSTEVFQKLIDEKYVDDPNVFYYPLQGKIKPTSKKLRPKNVSFDVTIPVDFNDSDELPTVFLTGYRIQYAPNGTAVPLRLSDIKYSGLSVAYHSNSAVFKKDDGLSDHIVTNFISPNFDPAGKKYQQLTPNGPLPP